MPEAEEVLSRVIRPSPIVFCDFDGTITLADVTDEILKRLARPEWRKIERMWAEGRIGSRECLERQLALVETTPSALDALIRSIPLDPDFAAFCRYAQAERVPLVVVSDGLDYVLRRILKSIGLGKGPRNGTQFFSSSACLRKGKIRVRFPHASSGCSHGCATCKAQIIRRLGSPHWPVLYVGDGLSDRYAVEEADFVYARRPLLEYCRKHGIPSRFFRTFGDIESALADWLGGDVPRVVDEAARLRRSLAPAGANCV
jgi:2-hydroxy-3-keto-5-methylthiopentenyl-1-phosphate phosphatase